MGNFKKYVFKSILDFEIRPLLVTQETIKIQKQLVSAVKEVLPDELAKHVQHCVHSGQRLLIYTEAACWAAQIRFFNEAILNKMIGAAQQNITSLQVRIIPPIAGQPRTQQTSLPSAANIAMLHQHLQIGRASV